MYTRLAIARSPTRVGTEKVSKRVPILTSNLTVIKGVTKERVAYGSKNG